MLCVMCESIDERVMCVDYVCFWREQTNYACVGTLGGGRMRVDATCLTFT